MGFFKWVRYPIPWPNPFIQHLLIPSHGRTCVHPIFHPTFLSISWQSSLRKSFLPNEFNWNGTVGHFCAMTYFSHDKVSRTLGWPQRGMGGWWVKGGGNTIHFPAKMPTGSDQTWSWPRRKTILRDRGGNISINPHFDHLWQDFEIVCNEQCLSVGDKSNLKVKTIKVCPS